MSGITQTTETIVSFSYNEKLFEGLKPTEIGKMIKEVLTKPVDEKALRYYLTTYRWALQQAGGEGKGGQQFRNLTEAEFAYFERLEKMIQNYVVRNPYQDLTDEEEASLRKRMSEGAIVVDVPPEKSRTALVYALWQIGRSYIP